MSERNSLRGGKAPSQRQLRVGEELRHVLSAVLRQGGFRDPALAGCDVTVTEVAIGPDLRNATVFVTPLGGGDSVSLVAALNRASGFLRRQMAPQVRLKYLPTLIFAADVSFDHAARLEGVLDDQRVRRDLHSSDHPGADDGEANGA